MRNHNNHSFRIACIGLLGIVAAAGCGGSDTPTGSPDAKPKDTSVPDSPPTEAAPPSPILTLSTSSLPFGDVDVGQVSTPRSVIVTNAGGLVSLSPTVTPGSGFAISSTTCATPAASCTINVTFAPTVVGAASGTLTVASGLSVTLSGNGRTPGSFTATSLGLPATVPLNQAVPILVTITSTGPLTGLTCLPSGADLAPDATALTCTGTLPAAGTCQYGFIFKATTAGPKNESIVCSAGGTTRTVAVSTTVPTPASIAITPNPGNFTAPVGSPSVAITFNVANTGGTASGALSTALGGTDAKDFTIVDNKCVVPLAPLGICEIKVVFTPSSGTTKTATITVTDATVGSVPATTTLTGVPITGPAVTITGPVSLDSVIVGKSSAATTYTVTNNSGTATGALTMATNDPAFTISNDLCTGQTLAPTKACTLAVTFKPTKVGLVSILITASAGGSVIGSLQIGGTGATAAVLSMTPPQGLDFGTIGVGTTSTPQTFTVTNTGGIETGPLTVTNAGVGGASQFASSTTCQAALKPSATCEIVVTFKPIAAGSASANFSVSDGAITSPVRTAVGTALERPGITIGCVPSTFAETIVGQTSAAVVCTVTNDSTSKQATGALTTTTTGDFAVTTNNCAASLEPGLSCTMSVVFKPTAAGARTGAVAVTGASGGTGNRNLSGTGLGTIEIQEFTAPGTGTVPVAVTAGDYDFGSVSTGAISDVTLTLAVYIRSAVGNISLAKAFGTPADFTAPVGAVSATWPGTTTATSVAACPATTTTAPTPSATIPYCTIKVQFTPQSKAAKTGSVTATAADGVTKATATFKGTAAGPLSANPSTVTFAAVAPGSAGAPTTIAVCNNAATQATAGQFTITGTNAADFTVTKDELSNVTIPAKECVDLAVNVQVPASETATSLSATLTVSAVIAGVTESDTVALAGSTAGGPALQGTVGTFADTPITAVSAPVTVTVRNSGGLSSGALSFSVPAGSEFTMTQTGQDRGTCGTSCTSGAACTATALQAGGSCTIRLWFAPTPALGVGGRTDILRIAGAAGALAVVPLSATASSQFTITPDSLDLGAAGPAGAGAEIKNVVVRNVGGDDATMAVSFKDFGAQTGTSVVTGGVFATAPATTCGGELAAGASCTIAVRMMHTADILGPFATTLLAVNSTNGQSASVVVRGVAGESILRFTPATDKDRAFGTIRRNGSSGPITYTVTNVGSVTSGPITFGLYDTPLATPPVAHTTDFAVGTGTGACVSGATTLAANASCDIVLTFNPVTATANGLLRETLIVTASPGATGDGLRRGVTATAMGEAVAYMATNTTSPAGLFDFGTAGQTVTLAVYNAGTGDFTLPATSTVDVTNLNLAGTETGNAIVDEFTIVTSAPPTGTCGGFGGGSVTTLAAGEKCTFRVRWSGVTATPGSRAVRLTADTLGINLYARIAAPVLVATPASLSFGNISINNNTALTLTVAVRNIGDVVTGNVGPAKTSATPGDITFGTGCSGTGSALDPNEVCYLPVIVNPSTAGAGSGTVTVQTPPPQATPDQSVAVDIDWVGVNSNPANITITPAGTLTFSSVPVLSSVPATLTLTNAANGLATGPLSITVDSPDFTVDTGTTTGACGSLAHVRDGLVAADSCTVTVTFTPRTLGTGAGTTKTGTLTVTSPYAATATKALSGTTVSPLTVSAHAVATTAEDPLVSGGCTFTEATGTTSALCAFGSRPVTTPTTTTFRSETITFENAAGSPTTGTLVADLTLADAGNYKIVNDTCTGKTVAGGATCKVTVRFSPTSAGTKNTASLVLSGNPGDSVTVRLNGTGTTTGH